MEQMGHSATLVIGDRDGRADLVAGAAREPSSPGRPGSRMPAGRRPPGVPQRAAVASV